MPVKTTTLGGTASDIVVANVAHGLMLMTWKPTHVPDEECFEAIIAGIDQLPAGAKLFINSGEFYGTGSPTANLELLARFFKKYPEYADKTFLSVKGGINLEKFQPDSSPEGLRRSVDNINAKLGGYKKLDLFESARVDPNVPIEEAVKNMAALVKEGKFDHIGLSECSAATVKRANAVHPIAAVEIEVSPWSYEEETKKVLATCRELEIPVLAYSPLGRGFLTGQIKKPEDLEEGDMRRRLDRFQADAMQKNFKIVEAFQSIAAKKGITAAQLCIAWVASLGPKVIPLPGSSNKKRKLENLEGGSVELSQGDLDEIAQVLASTEIEGGRYVNAAAPHLHLWG
ncbi:aldo/keto reductase [Punctularia strigosozonata HHB-11173 SS5]|uniref:aldo/keto reductase n=1 Tax=Punctularia strigosozonata (strain HHB-11173) TaxID=741275 RepID=UPI0004418258|nr:aldo/keto reductase [Punctularia strigosozonata HHB-11173 SS5]EIN06640.1 aldo/keto reductase [Punctularia strigosozonata HHB-11173 SS5]